MPDEINAAQKINAIQRDIDHDPVAPQFAVTCYMKNLYLTKTASYGGHTLSNKWGSERSRKQRADSDEVLPNIFLRMPFAWEEKLNKK